MGNTLDTYGKPVISATPTQTVVDMQAIANFADSFANVRRGLASERTGLVAGKIREGMLFLESDTGRGYQRRSGTWAPVMGPFSARMKRSATAKAVGNTTINQSLSANNLWTEDWRDTAIAAYNDGWTIPFAGEWEVDYGCVFSGQADLFIAVNKTALASNSDYFGYAQGTDGAAGFGMPQGSKRMRFAAGDVVRMFAASKPASVNWDTAASSWFGIKFVGD